MTAAVSLSGVSKTFAIGSEPLPVFVNFSLDFAACECVALLGRSGLGKTTLLNLICGLDKTDEGNVRFDPKALPYSLVPQLEDLAPWRTIAGNLDLGAELANRPAPVSHRDRIVDLLGLRRFLSLYPHQVSGGMKRKALIGRALMTQPSTLLFDEPFASLDFPQRAQLIEDIHGLLRSDRYTVILVTHDVDEAIALADRLIVLGGPPATVRLDISNPIEPGERRLGLSKLRAVNQFPALAERLWAAVREGKL